jgi:hypothetical protein
MATYRVPIEQQPEFDEMQPLAIDQRIFLALIRPFLQVGYLFTMPRRLYQKSSTPRRLVSEPATNEQWAALPPVVRSHFDESTPTLAALGFGAPHRRITRIPSGSAVPSLQLLNASSHEVAVIFAAVAPRRFIRTAVSFHSCWEDGSRTLTSNSEEAELFPSLHRPPQLDSLMLPGLDDIRRLYEIHRRRAFEAMQRGRRPLKPSWEDPQNNPTALLRRNIEAWQAQVISSGLYRAVSTDEMRLTWKGAVLMSWARLQPFESYLAWQGRRRTAAALG